MRFEKLKDTFNVVRHYVAHVGEGLGLPVGIAGTIAGTAAVAGLPAGIGAALGASVVTLGSAMPMEFASTGMKVFMAALPFIGAAAGGAIGGLMATTALAGSLAGVVALGVSAAVGFGLMFGGGLLAPDFDYQRTQKLEKSVERAGTVAKVIACAAIALGAYSFKDDIRALPQLKFLFKTATTSQTAEKQAAPKTAALVAAPRAA